MSEEKIHKIILVGDGAVGSLRILISSIRSCAKNGNADIIKKTGRSIDLADATPGLHQDIYSAEYSD